LADPRLTRSNHKTMNKTKTKQKTNFAALITAVSQVKRPQGCFHFQLRNGTPTLNDTDTHTDDVQHRISPATQTESGVQFASGHVLDDGRKH
jgi:hypothetical protein